MGRPGGATSSVVALVSAALVVASLAAGSAAAADAVPLGAARWESTGSLGVQPSKPAIRAAADADSPVDLLRFDSFDAQYYLSRDESGRSRLRVVETLVAVFPQADVNRGIIRAIPLDSQEYDLHLDVESVTDGDGTPVPFDRQDYGGFAELALGTDEFVHGRVTYVIEYTMRDVARAFSTGDEFYWDVNGDGWWQTFDGVSSTVHLAPDLVPALTGETACYAGYSSDVPCQVVASSDRTEYSQAAVPLGFRATVTVAIGFEAGTFSQPALAKDSWVVTTLPLVLVALMLLLLVTSVVVRLFVWRHASGRGIVTAQYSVPAEIDLLLAGEIVGRSKNAMSAELLHLAVTNRARLIDRSPTSSTDDDYDLELLEEEPRGVGSSADDAVLRVLFPGARDGRGRVSIDRLSAAKGGALFTLVKAARGRATSAGLLARPQAGIARWIRRAALLVLVGHVVTWVFAFATDLDADDGGDLISGMSVISIVLAVVISIILLPPYRLTSAGADLRDHLLGVRLYISLAEADRLRVLQSPSGAERIDVGDPGAVLKLNERLLPFAVLFGLEREWATVLQVEYSTTGQQPVWLSSSGSLDLTRSMASFTSRVGSSVRSPPSNSSSGGSWSGSGSSSSSGGSSGGGSSGGGSGGGGGGGR